MFAYVLMLMITIMIKMKITEDGVCLLFIYLFDKQTLLLR